MVGESRNCAHRRLIVHGLKSVQALKDLRKLRKARRDGGAISVYTVRDV